MKGLLLHCGASAASLERIENVPTPEPSGTHFPIRHGLLIRQVRAQLQESGVVITEEAYGLSTDGMRLFGVLALRAERLPTIEGSDLILGIRNSHDKTFCAGLALGARIFVCDNLSFTGTRTLARKHTRNVERDLPGLIARILGQLGDWAKRQMERICSYQAVALDDMEAHDFMIQAIRMRIIAPSKITPVIDAWHKPERPRDLWSLFNDFTATLKGTIELSELARRTEKLHGLTDLRVAKLCGLLESQLNGNGKNGGNGSSGHGGAPAMPGLPSPLDVRLEEDDEDQEPDSDSDNDPYPELDGRRAMAMVPVL
ncbi:DUF932 domain-containing protein [Candidatus Sumerlaeota bacterium]|nr:DUF932 domain-containing protein [Candidatus Sumerlaeota bacterium]